MFKPEDATGGYFLGGAIVHFNPDSKFVSGIGGGVGRTFGLSIAEAEAIAGFEYDINYTIIDAFYNVDYFFNDKASLNIKAGIQHLTGSADYSYTIMGQTFSGTFEDSGNGFLVKAGISIKFGK